MTAQDPKFSIGEHSTEHAVDPIAELEARVKRREGFSSRLTLTSVAADFRKKIIQTKLARANECQETEPPKPLESMDFDLIVVGGGITGAGILREAARRGLKVLLVEQKDFAWGTSSRSSKMVHGGLRYLGEGKIGLTRESVKERQRYLNEAPGLVDVMRYLMVHKPKQFPPRWIFQVLLGVYDFFAGKKYRQSIDEKALSSWLGPISAGDAIGGSVFADAVTDDSRLVFRTLTEAINDCAVALNYTKVSELLRNDEGRVIGVKVDDNVLGKGYELTARAVVNATGAWAKDLAQINAPDLRPLRGSHLVVPFWKLPVSCSISMLHPQDKRPVFIFPWQGTAVIGTTDIDHVTSLDSEASISQEEVDYLLAGANYYLSSSKISERDVISTWAGVRPVISSGKGLDPSKENREHTIWQEPGLITVSGGKLTTFRVIAFDVLSKVLNDEFGQAHGKRINDVGQSFFTSTQYAEKNLGSLSARVKRRLSGRYGIKAFDIVSQQGHNTRSIESTIGFSDISWAELEWAVEHESVEHLDDLMLRRSRLGNVCPHLSETDWNRIEHLCFRHLGWTKRQWEQELERYNDIWRKHYALPSAQNSQSVSNIDRNVEEESL
jgi:glycerol-3-phosphate dehydrogenase